MGLDQEWRWTGLEVRAWIWQCPPIRAKIGVMGRTCLKWGYGLVAGIIGEVSGVCQLSIFIDHIRIQSETEFLLYEVGTHQGCNLVSFPHFHHVQPNSIPFPYASIAWCQAAQQAAQDFQEGAGSGACGTNSMQEGEGATQVEGEGAEGAWGGSTEGGRGEGAVWVGGGREVYMRGKERKMCMARPSGFIGLF